jgi:hypothetical protein
MNDSSLRQKYLSLVARLYELAAEFTDSELKAIHENLVARDDRGIAKAIDALMMLHGVVETAKNVPSAERAGPRLPSLPPMSSSTRLVSSPPKTSRKDSLSGESLEKLLNDRDIFPRTQDVVKVVPGNLQLQSKEGRGRYIKRVIRHVASLDESSRNKFRKVLSDELAKRPHNFVSQWKNLIKEL